MKHIFAGLVFTAVFVCLASCSASQSTGSWAGMHKPRIFGATYMTKNNPFFDILDEGIEEVVHANGDVLLTRNPLQDQQKQNEQIMELIDAGMELLFLNPVDWEGVAPALEACQQANVAIINVDTAVKDTDKVVTIIETDHYQAGQNCALDMMKRTPCAKIVVLDNPIQKSICSRIQGFKDAIEGNENYQIVYETNGAGEIEVSANVMESFLQKNIQFQVILGGNDPSALGALATLQKYHIDENKLIYGIDGSPDFKAMLEMGYVTGTSAQTPRQIGKTAAETAYAYLNGLAVENHVLLPSELITKENLNHDSIYTWQ